MSLNLMFHLSINMSFVALAAYLIGRNQLIIRCALNPSKPVHCLILSLIFSLLSAVGTYTGVLVNDALANTRLVGVIMSGFMGGPVVGVITGAASAFYRYSFGGFTAEVCAVASIFGGGLLAGVVRHKVGFAGLTWKTGAAVALTAEVIQKAMVLLFAKPFEQALALEKLIALPTMLVSIMGSVIFMVILKNIQAEQSLYAAKAAEVALEIASRTLPYAKQGLNSSSAAKITQIIHTLTQTDAVAITNTEKVLSFTCAGQNHNAAAVTAFDPSIRQVLATGRTTFHNDLQSSARIVDHCPFHSCIIAPLTISGKTIGTIKLFRTAKTGISSADIRIADGVANLLSVQFELASLDQQILMREKAELRALQAQINPHFLFNTMTIIMSFCRTDPDTARVLLSHLSTLMQRRFKQCDDFIPLSDELEGITAYLEIAKRRFGKRLTVRVNTEPAVDGVLVPVLSIQPLVENAIQHGLFPKLDQCLLQIDAYRKNPDVVISVTDNGIGINADKLKQLSSCGSDGIGLKNVNGRLISIYGAAYALSIDSSEGAGTTITVRIPMNEVASNAV